MGAPFLGLVTAQGLSQGDRSAFRAPRRTMPEPLEEIWRSHAPGERHTIIVWSDNTNMDISSSKWVSMTRGQG